jgi:hypothetical protein
VLGSCTACKLPTTNFGRRSSKDLAQVEQAFRNCKTVHLETRPVQVRTATCW